MCRCGYHVSKCDQPARVSQRPYARILAFRSAKTFDQLCELSYYHLFFFCYCDLSHLVPLLQFPQDKNKTTHSCYAVIPLPSTRFVLRPLVTSDQWVFVKDISSKFALHVLKSFCDAFYLLMKAIGVVLISETLLIYVSICAKHFVKGGSLESNHMEDCVLITDWTISRTACLSAHNRLQRVSHSGHKQRHTLKILSNITPDGICIPLFGQ